VAEDLDIDARLPGRILASTRKRIDVAVFSALTEIAEGRFQPGHRVLGMKEGGIGLSEMKFTRQLFTEEQSGWAAVAGALKCWRRAHEVVTTIMLNYVAVGLSRYLVDGPLNAGTYTAQSKHVAVTAQLPVLWSAPPMAVDAGLLLAAVLAVLVAVGLRRTVWGYEVRVVGGNPRAATEAGISEERAWFTSLLLGGAMAGLAGAELVLGMERVFTATLSPGFGYDGIAVALLAGGEAGALPLSALFFASLRSADKALQLEAGLSPRVIYVVQAVLILAVAARAAWRGGSWRPHWRRRRPAARAEAP
jgi:ABC-type uncharacterized transport system permease subunit